MKNIDYAGSGMRRRRLFQLIALICLLGTIARADIADVGLLSYDTFIPAGNGSPGTYAFDIYNLTGAFSLPPDFPVTDGLTFGAATLTLTLSDSSQQVFNLGDIGPGFLADQNGNPIVQVPGDGLFDSAEFTATLSPLTFALSGGTQFTANSSSIDVLLLASSGSTLTVDVDQTTIGVSGTGQVVTPEPSSGYGYLSAALLGLASWLRRRRSLRLG